MNLEKLNKEQLDAVTSLEKHILVLAGAGTGKTKVLINRIAYLIENGMKENEIVAFTFTNKAAKEMKERLSILLGRPHQVSVSTFHSYCYYLLKDFKEYLDFEKYFTILEEDDKNKLIHDIITQYKLPIKDSEISKQISFIKNHKKQNLELKNQVLLNIIFQKYQTKIMKMQRIDLDDLLYLTYKLLKSNYFIKELYQEGISCILVDEYQDTNKIQYEIINLLSSNETSTFFVGDQDQCIYSFRGSNEQNIYDYISSTKAKIYKLEYNYRSSPKIIETANFIIKNNKKRIDKTLKSIDNTFKYNVIYGRINTDFDEAVYASKLIIALRSKGYLLKDIAILYRNNFLSVCFEQELTKQCIPYQLHGLYPFFKHKEIRILIAYLNLMINEKDDISFEIIINTPPRGIGVATYNKIISNAKNNNISLMESLKNIADDKNSEALNNFMKLYQELRSIFTSLYLETFIKLLMDKLHYQEFILTQPDSKIKLNRINEFCNIIQNMEIDNLSNKTAIDFINNIYLDVAKTEAKDDKVNLLTIHQAKGLEFKVVILIGLNEGILPYKGIAEDELAEERRIFYVAVTRAKERLYLLAANYRSINGVRKHYGVSRFVNEISGCVISSIT